VVYSHKKRLNKSFLFDKKGLVNANSGSSETPGKKKDGSSDHVRSFMFSDKQATCKLCGLTARNQVELDDHIHHAHVKQDPKQK
jgi:hypothetical protein